MLPKIFSWFRVISTKNHYPFVVSFQKKLKNKLISRTTIANIVFMVSYLDKSKENCYANKSIPNS